MGDGVVMKGSQLLSGGLEPVAWSVAETGRE